MYFNWHLGLGVAAAITFPIMHTDHVPAAGAAVSLGLVGKKSIHALRVYCFEVFNHAHAVAFPISFVKVGKFLAGHGVALATGVDFIVG